MCSQAGVRIPLTASSWLGIPTNASAANAAKYPNLAAQYRRFIVGLVGLFTRYNIVVIADLHWTDDVRATLQPCNLATPFGAQWGIRRRCAWGRVQAHYAVSV